MPMSFDERLKKLQAQNDAGAAPAKPATHPAYVPEPAPFRAPPRDRGGSGGFGKAVIVLLVVVFVVMVGLAFVTLQQTSALEDLATPEIGGMIAQETPENGVEAPQAPGFMARLIGGPLNPDGNAEPGARPVAFLPPAPKGWLRVSQTEAADAGIADRLRAEWPGGVEALRAHPGYQNLNFFLKANKTPDMETRVLSQKRGNAIYLEPNGEWVMLTVSFLDAKAALGDADAPETWLGGLGAKVGKKADSSQVVETVTLGSVRGINLTAATPNPRQAPIAERRDAPNQIALSVPLAHRVLLRFEGYITPNRVPGFITAMPEVDYSALVN